MLRIEPRHQFLKSALQRQVKKAEVNEEVVKFCVYSRVAQLLRPVSAMQDFNF